MSDRPVGVYDIAPPLPPDAHLTRPWTVPDGLGASSTANFIRSFRQDDWAVRGMAATIDGMLPPTADGYNAFEDPSLVPFMTQNRTSVHLFDEARSPEHAQRIMDRILADRRREQDLEFGGASWSRMIAGMLGTTSLATLPLGMGTLSAPTALGRAAQGARNLAVQNAVVTAGDVLAANQTLPGDLQRSLLPEVAMGALVGAAFGGVFGPMTRPRMDALAAQHADLNDAADGLRTPGIPDGDRVWYSRPDADPVRLAERQELLGRIDAAISQGDAPLIARLVGEGENSGLVPAGDAAARPLPTLTPEQAVRAVEVRNMDGGASERVLVGTPRQPGEPLPLSSGASGIGVTDAVRPDIPTGVGGLFNHSQMPWWKTVLNDIPGQLGNAIAGDASRLAQVPLSRMDGNRAGQASVTSSVEARARQFWGLYARADLSMQQAYHRARGFKGEAGPVMTRIKAIGTVLENAAGVRDAQGLQLLTYAEFRKLVGQAMHTGVVPVDSMGREVPEALVAAKSWTDDLFVPMELAGAEAGVILSPRHRPLAEARFAEQIAKLEAMLEDVAERIKEANKPGTALEIRDELRLIEQNIRGGIQLFNERLAALSERSSHGGKVYAPQRWVKETVRAGREKLAEIFRLNFVPDTGSRWANKGVRAEITISHILGEGAGDTLERAMVRHFIERGMTPETAAARAANLVADVRELEIQPSSQRKVASEVASALGKQLGDRGPDQAELRAAVEKAVTDAGMHTDDMPRLVNEIVRVSGAETDTGHNWRNDYRPHNSKERMVDVPADQIIDFLDTDIAGISQTYVNFMGPAIETAKEFGDAGMMVHSLARRLDMVDEVKAGRMTMAQSHGADNAMKNLRDVVQRIHAVPDDPDAMSVRTLRFLANYAIIRQMGSALVPNLLDAARGTMAVGFRNTMEGMLDQLRNRDTWRLAGDEAAKAGAALDMVTLLNARAQFDMQQLSPNANRLERLADAGASQMAFMNGVAPWTQLIQRFFGGMIQSEMVELSAKEVAGTITAKELTQLRSLGIDTATAGRIEGQWRAAGAEKTSKLHLANTDAWSDAALRDQFRAMLTTAVDLAVTKPGAADRPLFLSSPLGQVLFLYKGFAIASTQRMLLSGIAQRDMRVLSGMTAGITLAWLITNATASKYDKSGAFSDDRIYEAINRSGWLGILGDLSNTMEVASNNGLGLRPLLGIDPPGYAKAPGWGQRTEAVLGAGVSPFFSAMDAFTGGDGTQGEQAGTLRRLIPFQNWLPIAAATRGVGDAVKDAMPGLPRRSPRESSPEAAPAP